MLMRHLRTVAGLALALSLLTACSSRGAAVDNPYVRPGRLVALPDGRHLNLRCSGRGSPTVLLESGWGGSSGGWYKVQPALAKTTRVCAYDRAGYGFSDPGPLPRDGAAIVRDLDQGLTAADIRGPFVLVGHSAGGLYVRLFAARRPEAVQGLILLDPTVERHAPQPSHDGLDGIRRRLQRCLRVLETTPQTPEANPDWTGCVSSKADAHSVQTLRRPDAWRQQLSELDVITASETAMASPTIAIGVQQSALEYAHQLIASQSSAGSQTTVLSSHLVMIDRPEVVIDAVSEMVRASRNRQRPAPLPRSETLRPEPDPFTTPEPASGPFDSPSILEFPPVTK
jgi:pimeloyl-ACP methyl ester carboxylesterase